MSSSAPGPAAQAGKKSERYHHGDLRHALLDAARDLAAEVGVDGFTLREVARRAGVSHAAPYHHFPDKAALIRSLAVDAFKRLTEAMSAATTTSSNPLEQLDGLGLAYVEFALSHPVEFRFMFRRDLCLSDAEKAAGIEDELEVESLKSLAVMQRLLKTAEAEGLVENAELAQYTCWSAVHGMATLILDAPGFENLPLETARQMTRGVLHTLHHGFETRRQP